MTKELNCNTIHEFIENYRIGYDVIKGVNTLYQYYDYEKRFINHINNNTYSITVKGRQLNITTLLASYTAWRLMNGKVVGYISNRLEMGYLFREKVNSILKNASYFDINEKIIDNKREIKFFHGGILKIMSTNVDEFCGWSFDDIIFDEACFIKNFEKLYFNAEQAKNKDGKMILVSTPQSYDKFYQIWEGSFKGTNPFKRLRITFMDNPNRDSDWLESMKKTMGYDQDIIKTELYAEFLNLKPKKYKKKNKDNLIQFRIDDDLYLMLCQKLIDDDISVSKYMRNLLIKNVNN